MNIKDLDKWAEIYNLTHGQNKSDFEFYKNEAKKIKGRVLEIACGTGRIYLGLLKEGVDIWGIDLSKKMLEILKKDARKLKLKPKVYKADMRNFNLRKKFSLIIVPFRSFLHNLTADDQVKTLRNIRRHLAPGGRLVLNFFFPKPDLMVEGAKKWKGDTIKTKNGNFKLIGHGFDSFDEINQIVKFKQSLYKEKKKIWSGNFKMAYIYKREFELLLQLSSFKKWKVYGGFEYKPLKDKYQEMVWIIEK